MSVQLNPPHTLGFRRPLTQLVKRSLTVSNPNAQPVAFKVKTTAPKLYCVRPNSGRIEPGETVEVQVMLQAMKEEPPLATKCKDKFLIQSTYITAAKETLPLQEIWNSTDDGNEESKVHQQKVKVAYLATEGTIDEEDEAQAHMSSMMSQSDSKYDTVRPYQSVLEPNGHGLPDFEAQKMEPAHEEIERSHTPAAELREPTPEPAPAPAPAARSQPAAAAAPPPAVVPAVLLNGDSHAVSGVSPDEHADLLQRYTDAQNELQRMRALLQAMPDPSLGSPGAPPSVAPSGSVTEAGLRRRARALSDVSSTMADSYVGGTDVGSATDYDPRYKPDAPEGVPLQIVIVIALGVFVTTYLFF